MAVQPLGWFQTVACDGLRVHIFPTRQFKTVTCVLTVQVPLAERTVTPTAMLAQVLQRGSCKYPTIREMKQYLDHLYGATFHVDVDKRGERQVLQLYLDLPHEKFVPGERELLEKAIAFLSEVLLHPLLEDEDRFVARHVEAGRIALRRKIEGIIDDKIQYAQYRCVSEMCRNEPYRLLPYGRLEDLPAIEAAGLYRHYRRLLADSQMDLFVVGDVREEQVVSLVEKHLSLPSRHVQLPPASGEFPPVENVRRVVEEMDVMQGKLNMGLRTGGLTLASTDYPTLMMYNGLLGGFPHSKLFRNVREEASLAYYAFSRLESLKGLLLIQTGIEVDNYEKAVDIVQKQLNMMRQGDFTPLEMEQTKAMLMHHLREVYDRTGSLIDFAFRGLIANMRQKPDELMERIAVVNKDDIQRVAEKIQMDTIYFLRNRRQQKEAGAYVADVEL